MSLERLYQAQLAQNDWQVDDLQTQAVKELAIIQQQIYTRVQTKWYQRTFKISPITGLYMYGGVGRGKTWLMDLFHQSLAIKNKQRLHYHALMHKIHTELAALQGVKNPVQKIARNIKEKSEVLCLDEFFVHDIGDAMIMAELMQALRAQKVVLIITSNTAPEDLYEHGLQRSRFLPAIEHIKAMTTGFSFSGEIDYRLQKIIKNYVLFQHDDDAKSVLQETFVAFSKNLEVSRKPLMVNKRPIICKYQSSAAIWILFDELCNRPHGQNDYLEIAKNIKYLLIENIPALSDEEADQVARLIHLIDVCYDAKVKIIASSQGEIEKIYTGQSLQFDFARTKSRLYEMKSEDYWTELG